MTQWLVRRGLLATVPVASLVLAFGACSSDQLVPGERASESGSTTELAGGLEVAPSTKAQARLTQVSKQFMRAAVVPRQKAPELPVKPGVLPPPKRPIPAELPLEPRPVITKGEAHRFVSLGDRIRADVSADVKARGIRSANIDLPRGADGFVRIQPDDSPVGIEFATKGAKPGAPFEAADGVVTYAGAAPGGGDLMLRVNSNSVEDFVVLNERPAQPFVDYAVNVSDVAGLRLYDNTLEFLDRGGDPKIRVRPPELVDALGKTHKAKLALQDCAADTSHLLPWDRPVTPPGASECTVRVSWNDTTVAYPAILDPVWATADDLTTPRYRNAAVTLANGFVLTCGGLDSDGNALASCEVYNPGTNNWATGATMKAARSQFTMILLGNDVLAVGDITLRTSELLSAGTWVTTLSDFSVNNGFSPLMPAATSDGAWVVLVDNYGRAYRYNVATKAWSTGAQAMEGMNPSYRYDVLVMPIPGQGTIMRAGGSYSSTFNTVERYNPATDSWTAPGPAASMTGARSNMAYAIIDSNRLIVYGGYNSGSQVYLQTSEVYSGNTNTWAAGGTIPSTLYSYQGKNTWARHGSGKIVTIENGVWLYDPAAPAASAWAQVNTYDTTAPPNEQYFSPMGWQTAIATAGARVMLAPVTLNNQGPQARCKLFDLGEKGAACESTPSCKAGLTCVKDCQYCQGYCCDSACTDACSSCFAQSKQSQADTGTCGPRWTQSWVGNTACPATDASTCGTIGGYCDGAGACAKWPNTTVCVAGSCADGDTQNNDRMCDGSGTCGAASTTNCTAGYACVSGECRGSCNDDSECTSTYFCQFWSPSWNTCQPKKANGAACTGYTNAECASGNCVDGVCCDDACDGLCESCLSTQTGQTTGNCKPILASAGSTGDCGDNGAASCGQNGVCDGAGACQLYANGTQCADVGVCASETARYVPDTCNGTGSCVDKGTQNCATGYSCQNGACNTQCTSDANCASNYWCDTVTKVCVADRAQGASCARDAVCSGNANCVDGVCCDSACTGSCRSCLKARTGLATDGLCGNILDDTDPENECTTGAGYPQSCQAPGLCNGQGACRPYAKTGVECDTDECSDVAVLTTYACNGAGTCKASSQQCYPFKCDATNNICRVACSSNDQCVTGSFCDNGTCVGQLGLGEACTGNAQCGTGTFCANIGEGWLDGQDPILDDVTGEPVVLHDDYAGVCCDEACLGNCRGCKKSIKGGGSDGVCDNVVNNSDPADDCPASANPCGADGMCDGGGDCRIAPSGQACGPTKCQGNSVVGESCDGTGNCLQNMAGLDCSPYVCGDVDGIFECKSPCAVDDDCEDGYYCTEAACKKKLGNGQACTTSAICNSNYCVDGVCCDASCNGQCEACDVAGNEGICSPVEGEPHGTRTKCDFAGEECGGSCDGVNASACKYAPTGTSCGEPTCTGGIADSSTCDGQGSCRAADSERCAPYNCGEDDKCLDRCEIDDDCSQGYQCDEGAQQCVPAAVAAECSEDRQSSVGSNGITTPCKPFLCVPASGTCAVSCAATTDCAPEFVCEASTKTCLPAPPDGGTGEEEGCACRAAGAPSRSSNHYLALVALGAALTGLRRRRPRRHLSAE